MTVHGPSSLVEDRRIPKPIASAKKAPRGKALLFSGKVGPNGSSEGENKIRFLQSAGDSMFSLGKNANATFRFSGICFYLAA